MPPRSRRGVLPSPASGVPSRVLRSAFSARSLNKGVCASMAACAAAISSSLRTPLMIMKPFRSKRYFCSGVIASATGVAAEKAREPSYASCADIALRVRDTAGRRRAGVRDGCGAGVCRPREQAAAAVAEREAFAIFGGASWRDRHGRTLCTDANTCLSVSGAGRCDRPEASRSALACGRRRPAPGAAVSARGLSASTDRAPSLQQSYMSSSSNLARCCAFEHCRREVTCKGPVTPS